MFPTAAIGLSMAFQETGFLHLDSDLLWKNGYEFQFGDKFHDRGIVAAI